MINVILLVTFIFQEGPKAPQADFCLIQPRKKKIALKTIQELVTSQCLKGLNLCFQPR